MAKDKKVQITYFVLFLVMFIQSIMLSMQIRSRRELSEKQDRRELETSRRIEEMEEQLRTLRDSCHGDPESSRNNADSNNGGAASNGEG